MRPRARPAPAAALAGLVALALLSGCAEPSSPGLANALQPPASMSIVGLVQDETFAPVAGASVSIRMVGLATATDASGGFRFDGLTPSAYLVDVDAAGFQPATLTAEPATSSNASLNFILVRPPPLRPALVVEHFRGILQCAFEALIISPSCDSAATVLPGRPQVFNDTSDFGLAIEPNWSAVVVDVDFDPGQHPGLDGLRLAVRGARDSGEAGQYQQFGRFNASTPFTVVLEPGGTYPDGSGPVPASTSFLQFEVYPQSHGWHAVCLNDCYLGVAAGVDVTFDVYVSVFYNQEPPAGYTMLDG